MIFFFIFSLLSDFNFLTTFSGIDLFMSPRRRVEGHIHLSLSVRLSVRPFVRSSVCPPVRSYICPLVHSSVRSSIRLSVRLSVCPFVRLSVRPFVRPSVCPSRYRYMVCSNISSYCFRATALIFCRMFIHIMEVCMSTGF